MMRSCSRTTISATIAFLALVTPTEGADEHDKSAQEYIRSFIQKYQRGPSVYTPEEIVPILDYEKKGDFAAAFRVADEVVRRDTAQFYSAPMANWVKSLAFMHRADARLTLTGDLAGAIADGEEAARLGNLQASQQLADRMLGHYQKNPKYANVDADPRRLETYLRIGAELGSSRAAKILASNLWPNPLSAKEIAYWSLIGIVGAGTVDLSADDLDRMIHTTFGSVGASEIQKAVDELSPLSGSTVAVLDRLPQRGVFATLFADAQLRRAYGTNYGKRAREPQFRPSETPLTLELFRLSQAVADDRGLARAYLLVPGNRPFTDPYFISLEHGTIAEQLSPSDKVIVRCGSLTHIAQIYKVDRQAGTIGFVDGLFEYWQPTHNSCITKFELTPFKFGGFLATVPLQDVVPIIQAVITLRDRVITGGGAERSKDYVSVKQFLESDFYKFFHVRSVIDERLASGQSVVNYMTGAYQGNIFLNIRADKSLRIEEARLAIDRQWLGAADHLNLLGQDISKSFLAELTPPSGAQVIESAAKAIWETGRPAEQSARSSGRDAECAQDTYRGKTAECVIQTPSGKVTLQNISDPRTGMELIISITTEFDGPSSVGR